MAEAPEAIMFELKEPFGVIERLLSPGWDDRLYAGKAHDPAIHIASLQKLFDSGATIVNVHSGQSDQNKVIDFYHRSVLPEFARATSGTSH